MHRPTSPWLGEVLPAVAAALGHPLEESSITLPAARSAIVIVVDGLGWHQLQAHRGHARTLSSFQGPVLTTCLPSTTAAALTCFSTGRLPGETRMVGYSVRHGDSVMNLLQFAPGVDPLTWQPQETYFSRLEGVEPFVVTAPKFAGSGLTQAAFRGATFVGRRSLAERFEAAARLARERPSLTYLYWSEIDHAGHRYGPGSPQWVEELEDFDAELSQFLRRLPADTLVVLTADHGMVQVHERLDLAEIPALAEGVELLAGEGRAVHVHAEDGAAVRARWADYLGDRARILAPAEYPGVFGEGPGNDLMGEAVVFLAGNRVIVDSRTQSAGMVGLEGVHGSFTAEELEIPLLILS